MGPGGAERVVANILPELSKKYSVYLILLKNIQFYELPSNIKIINFSETTNPLMMIPCFTLYLWKLKNLIKKYQPVKIISFLEIANFVNILVNKNAIISFRTSLSFFEKSISGRIYTMAIKLLYPRAQKIIVNSKENKLNLITHLNLPQEKVVTIYNPVNITQLVRLKNKPLKLPFAKKTDQKIFITIGRMDKLKNISAIIESFKSQPVENILLIIGDGSERKNLQELIQKYNLKKQIFLLGRQKNVYKYLNTADYFIFASKVEGFPNVLIEAMACNLPIITSDFKTGAREIIDPNLNFNKKIKYPHYGPNGVLLSLSNLENDFQKVDLGKLIQQKIGFDKFKIDKIFEKWLNLF